MHTSRLLTLASVAATLASGLGPATARPGARSDIDDLAPAYTGGFYSTDGSDQGGNADLAVTGKTGKSFEGNLTFFVIGSDAETAGFTPFPVEGSVSPKGKLAMKGSIPGGGGSGPFKLSAKGTLSDEGELIVASCTVKEGKTTTFKAIFHLEED